MSANGRTERLLSAMPPPECFTIDPGEHLASVLRLIEGTG